MGEKTFSWTLAAPRLTNMSLAPGFKSPDASKLEYNSYQKCLGSAMDAFFNHFFGCWGRGANSSRIMFVKMFEVVLDFKGCDECIEMYQHWLFIDHHCPSLHGYSDVLNVAMLVPFLKVNSKNRTLHTKRHKKISSSVQHRAPKINIALPPLCQEPWPTLVEKSVHFLNRLQETCTKLHKIF